MLKITLLGYDFARSRVFWTWHACESSYFVRCQVVRSWHLSSNSIVPWTRSPKLWLEFCHCSIALGGYARRTDVWAPGNGRHPRKDACSCGGWRCRTVMDALQQRDAIACCYCKCIDVLVHHTCSCKLLTLFASKCLDFQRGWWEEESMPAQQPTNLVEHRGRSHNTLEY